MVQGLESSTDDSSFYVILSEIKNLMSIFAHISLVFTNRSTNQAPHILVDYSEWFFNPPTFLCKFRWNELIFLSSFKEKKNWHGPRTTPTTII